MTREEIIQYLNILKVFFLGSEHQPIFDAYFALDEAIKLLEQEPILDKIRAELHATAEMHEDGDYYLRDEWIDEYFDKYKKSEGDDNV